MKKLLAILLAGLMVFTVVACDEKNNNKNDDDEKYRDNTIIVDSLTEGTDTFRFENVDSETVIIAEFTTTLDKAHEVKIPAYFMMPGNEREQEPDKYLRVVGIGKEAFANNSSVSSLVFPTEEEYKAHDEKFVMSEHTFTVGDYAFKESVALQSIALPAYVTEIGVGAFYGCVALGELTFAEGSRLTEIKDHAFIDCNALQSVEFPASLKTIGTAAFFECAALESVTVNEGTLTVGAQAFQNCPALAEVKLPASLETIGQFAFHGCKSLYKEGWIYAGVAPEELGEEVDRDSDEFKQYQKELAQYTAIKAYESSLALQKRLEEAPEVPETPAE